MNLKAARPLLLLGSFISAALGQDPTIGDAIEQPELIWKTDIIPADPRKPEIEQSPEKLWKSVTDMTFDGTDAASVSASPADLPTWSRLSTEIEGPFRLRFRSKQSLMGGANLLQLRIVNADDEQIFYENITATEEWSETWVSFSQTGLLSVTWQAQFYDDPNGQVWLDNVEIVKEVPPEIVYPPLPSEFNIPLGKEALLGTATAIGSGEFSYQWFKNGEVVEGATEASILIPASLETGEFQYQVVVTDSLGTASSTSVDVRYFSLSEALDSDSLIFTIPDLESQNYSKLLAFGENSSNGGEALYLSRCDGEHDCDPQEHVTVDSISTQMEGPTIFTYFSLGPSGVFVNGEMVHQHDHRGNWFEKHIAINEPGIHTVTWEANYVLYFKSSRGWLDQISTSQKPIFLDVPEKQRTIEGSDFTLYYDYLTVGETTHQLIRNADVILESQTGEFNLKALKANQSGTYKIRLTNEFGQSNTTNDFEISIIENKIGDALEQPDLEWSWEGPGLWISQIYDTYDGEDAAASVSWNEPDSSSGGRLMTTIKGPAYLSFWWGGGYFGVNDREQWIVDRSYGDWRKAELLLTSQTNELSWSASLLDRVQIEFLDDDPFKLWAFQKFDASDVISSYPEVRDGDRDFDGFSNLVEWALNKNIDFPNNTLPFSVIELDGKRFMEISFSKPANLGAYEISLEACNDLKNWKKIDSSISETFNASNDTYTVTIRDIQALDTKDERFIRLVISDEG